MENSKNFTPTFRFFALLWHYKKPLLIVNISVAVIALIISLLLPKWYEGRLVFIINEDFDLKSSIASSVTGSFGIPSGLFGVQAQIISEQYINFLKSHTILDKIDSIYHLQEEYNVKYRKILYKSILQNAKFTDNGDNTVTIYFYYKEDPIKAAQIANSFYLELDKLVNKLRQNKNMKIRIFLEQTYENTMNQLKRAEDKLATYQLENKIFSLEDQIGLSVRNISDLELEKIKLEVQKIYLEGLGASKTSEYFALENKIDALDNSINSLKRDDEYTDLPLEKLPEKGIEYIRLYREVKIRETILEFLIPQLENARLEEQGISSNLQIIDFAYPQDYKSKPKRLAFIFIVLFITFTISVLIAILINFIDLNKEKLREIIKS